MRFSIFSRLMTGYIAILILATGISIYAIRQLDKVHAVTYSIQQVDNALIKFQSDLSDALLSQSRYEKKYAIMRDGTLYESFVKSGEDFENYLQEAKLLTASPEISSLLSTIETLHRQYRTLFDEEAGYLRKGDLYSTEEFTVVKDRIVNEMLAELGRIKHLSQETIFRKVTALDESGTRARSAVITITGVSLLFGAGLSVFITRGITKPLRQMKKKTKQIAAGIFKADLNLPSPPEIGELAGALNLMCEKLREVDRMKSDFYALMSHELRTPLASIQEGTNLLLEGLGGEVAERQRRVLTIIAEESKRLIELVSSLLDLSKLEAGMTSYNFMKADLAPLITRAVEEVLPLAHALKITIEQDVPELPAVNMDSEQLLQVLRNLIGNALKFTPKGGTVCIRARPTEQEVRVSVIDTGPGIARSHLTTIFDKYQQSIQAGSRNLKGTGLGLAIVKHIIHAHGGKVWAESEPGQGSIFTFVLPA